MKYKREIPLIVVSILLMVLVGCTSPDVPELMAQQNTPTPDVVMEKLQTDIDRYQHALETASTEKERIDAEFWLNHTYYLATRVAAPTPTQKEVEEALARFQELAASYTPVPTPTPELGILESGIHFEIQTPRHVLIENIWQGYVNGLQMRVYAGLLIPDFRTGNTTPTNFGVVFVMSLQSDGLVVQSTQTTQDFASPFQESGALHITHQANDILSLSNDMGLRYTFDLSSLTLSPALPAAPTNLQAEYHGVVVFLNGENGETGEQIQQDYVRLFWQPIVPPIGAVFNVYRSPTIPVPIDVTYRIASDITTGSYMDSSGQYGYYYVVTAVNVVGESDLSNTAQALQESGCGLDC